MTATEQRIAERWIPKDLHEAIKTDNYAVYEGEGIRKDGTRYFMAMTFIGTARKHAGYYSFRTVERRNEYIDSFVKDQEAKVKRKAQRKEQRKQLINPFEIGDILDCSWGYEQTNIDFYQITEVKGMFVTLRQIAGRVTEYDTDMSGNCVAVPDAFIEREEPIRRKVCGWFDDQGVQHSYVKIESYSSASMWDGKPLSWSSWY